MATNNIDLVVQLINQLSDEDRMTILSALQSKPKLSSDPVLCTVKGCKSVPTALGLSIKEEELMNSDERDAFDKMLCGYHFHELLTATTRCIFTDYSCKSVQKSQPNIRVKGSKCCHECVCADCFNNYMKHGEVLATCDSCAH